MDKKDIMYGVLALVIILVIALVIKPMATGHPVNIGLPSPETPQPTTAVLPNSSNNSTNGGVAVMVSSSPNFTTRPTAPPSPTPTWNTQVKTVEFVDPSTYGISTNQTFMNGTRIDSIPQNTSMTTFATFSGKNSGTTQIMKVPFPYWELWYTVDPIAEQKTTTIAMTPTQGSSYAPSFISGSYSSVRPAFTLQVMDADDPNRIVRVITPPGGIDLNLWLGVTPTTPSSSRLKPRPSYNEISKTTVTDPRPWKERFFEGQRNYFFIINAQNLNSYKIDIRVPTKYIGQY